MTTTPLPARRLVPALALLTLLHVLNFTDRFLMQGFSVALVRELGLSALQFTLLTGVVFGAFYTLGGLAAGALADRVHRPRLVAAGATLWSLLTAATGSATGFGSLAATRLWMGVGEATLSPSSIGWMADTVPPRRRATALGVYYLGAPVGIGAAFIVAGTLGAAIGWRDCFRLLGALGLLLALAALLLPEPRATSTVSGGPRLEARELLGALPAALRTIASTPALRWLVAGGVAVIFSQGTLVLDQLWLVQERGFDVAHAQKLTGAMLLVGGVAGTLLGGLGADALGGGASGRLRFLALAYLVGAPAAACYRIVDPQGALFVPLMGLGGVMLTIGYGPLFASLQDLAPPAQRLAVTAATIMAMTLGGTALGNVAVGAAVDALRAQGVAQPITWAGLAGLLPWALAIPCFLRAAAMARIAGR